MTGIQYGFIAQEVIEVQEENMTLGRVGKFMDTDPEDFKAYCPDGILNKTQLTAKECILISAIKELSAKVTALENA